jgi:hypothetical protein
MESTERQEPSGQSVEDCKKLSDNLLLVILLRLGLEAFNSVLLYFLLTYCSLETCAILISYHFFLGNITFGVVLSIRIRESKAMAIPIIVLSLVDPTYGAIFYLLAVTILTNKAWLKKITD